MKIIKNGNYPDYPRQCTCSHCNSILEIEGSDVCSQPFQEWSRLEGKMVDVWDGNYYYTFRCPVCGSTEEVTE